MSIEYYWVVDHRDYQVVVWALEMFDHGRAVLVELVFQVYASSLWASGGGKILTTSPMYVNTHDFGAVLASTYYYYEETGRARGCMQPSCSGATSVQYLLSVIK
jgi:hypothetical protein